MENVVSEVASQWYKKIRSGLLNEQKLKFSTFLPANFHTRSLLLSFHQFVATFAKKFHRIFFVMGKVSTFIMNSMISQSHPRKNAPPLRRENKPNLM